MLKANEISDILEMQLKEVDTCLLYTSDAADE